MLGSSGAHIEAQKKLYSLSALQILINRYHDKGNALF